MAFFANSGLRWLQYERSTQAAGANTFHAASELWYVLAILENSVQEESNIQDQTILDSCAERLDAAAEIYRGIARELNDVSNPLAPERLTSTDFDLAAVVPNSYQSDIGLLPERWIKIGDLYNELGDR